MIALRVVLLDWSSPGSKYMAIQLVVEMGLSLARYHCSHHHPGCYVRWRWLFVTTQGLVILRTGALIHRQATPTHTFISYIANLFIASGITLGVQSTLLNREMFYLSCPGSALLVLVLCYYSEGVCRNGLTATKYSKELTREVFCHVGKVANVIANLLRPFENDPLLSVPKASDPVPDLPACMCLVRTLTVVFAFMLPNAMLYLYESNIIEAEVRRHIQHHRQQELAVDHDEGGRWAFHTSCLQFLMTGAAAIFMGGTCVWAGMRAYHDV